MKKKSIIAFICCGLLISFTETKATEGELTTSSYEEFADNQQKQETIITETVAEDSLLENETVAEDIPDVAYKTHVQNLGWLEYVSDGKESGTSGQSLRLEGLKIKLDNASETSGIQYQSHVQNIGWQDWQKNDELSGTIGEGKRLEAVRISLTGEIADSYDVYYQVHTQNFGWLGWAKNGEAAGSEGYGYRLEALKIQLIKKTEIGPTSSTPAFQKVPEKPTLTYQTHVQMIGWQNQVSEGETAGALGKNYRVEALKMNLANKEVDGNIHYSAHVQNEGWQNFVSSDEVSGTSGKSRRIEAIKIYLSGTLSAFYDVYYRVYNQDVGWLSWTKNGSPAGTEGFGHRLEGLQVKIVRKGLTIPLGSAYQAFYNKNESVYLNAPYINQYSAGAPMGCEAAALLEGLHTKGYALNYNLRNFLREMPVSKNGNPHEGFGGSPYSLQYGTYQSIFPVPLRNWGRNYGNVVDITNSHNFLLRDELRSGNPVVVYIIMDWKYPVYSKYFWGVGIDNMHVVLLDGYKPGAYHISDPASGKYWVNDVEFERCFGYLNYAVAIR